ncbi:DUF2637 domain-containing protein [Streptomyces griseofuscus]|uniref:DUF2637 domain-containing protein n=1 Tax=Streptomyces griseofuscus TaxID=146922 RepID=UPI0033EF252A
MAPPIAAVRSTATSESEIRAAERTLKAGTWSITAGAIVFSVLTVTPLVRTVTPPGWGWTAPILPVVVDAAVIIVVQLDSVISKLGGAGGAWPALLRWMTGVMTLCLNVGNSALDSDWVGVAVHSVAPLLLIVTAEAGLAYRRAISSALSRIAREQAEAAEQQRAQRDAREQRERDERERARAAQEQAAREEREQAERLERERAEREESRLEAERQHALALERERTAREENERAARIEQENAAREHTARMERERAERELAERRRREQSDRDREERERRDRERARAEKAAAAVAIPAPGRRATSAKVVGQPSRIVESVVLSDEFAGLTRDEAEAALFELYRAARDASVAADWEEDPLARPGGPFCGSNLGRRLGRSDASGRAKVKPKFERWYEEYQKKKAGQQELVGVG